jgi:Flp pilus assembly protein TadG
MLKAFDHTLGNQRGVAALEFALVAPILLLIVFATIEYGWYLTNWTVLTNAVAEGARAGVKAREWESDTHAAEDPKEFAEQALAEALWTVEALADENFDIEIIEADSTAPRRLRVTVMDLPYRAITGYLGKTMLPTVLAANAIMAFP